MRETLIEWSPYLVTLATLALTTALGALALYLRTKMGNSKTAGFVGWALETTSLAVAYVDANLKPKMKAAAADGVITPEEARQLRAEAARLALEFGGKALKEGIQRHFPGVAEAHLKPFMEGLVQRVVMTLPINAGPVPPPSPAPPPTPVAGLVAAARPPMPPALP